MTYEQVAKRADELKSRHPERKKPSVRQVYAEIGGDYNAVQKHMRTWRLTLVSASSEAAPSLSASILRALSDEITQQRNAATTAQSAELEECREELDDLQREYGVLSSRNADLDARLQTAGAERERLAAERSHQADLVAKLQEQVLAERAATENARIELVQTRLKNSGDADLVIALRGDLDARRAEIESERAARIEAERKLAASDASYQGLIARMEDLSARMEEVEADRDLFSNGLEMERTQRVEAERGRDIAEQRAVAAIARAEDLWAREAELRARLDQLTARIAKPQKPRTAPARPSERV